MIPLTGKLIYIVGQSRLQNVLMAFFLERETGAKCLTVGDFHDIQAINNGNIEQPKMVLWDCLGKDLETCLSKLESDGKEILAQDLVALFNVSFGLGIEQEAVARGVRGFFYEQDPLEQFPKGISAIFNEELWLSRKIMSETILNVKKQKGLSIREKTALTPRQIEILAMISGGATNQNIADKLYISPHTVKTHLYTIFKKIEVPNRFQAALWAAKNL